MKKGKRKNLMSSERLEPSSEGGGGVHLNLSRKGPPPTNQAPCPIFGVKNIKPKFSGLGGRKKKKQTGTRFEGEEILHSTRNTKKSGAAYY